MVENGSIIMSDVKRRKVGASTGVQKKRHVPESSPPPAQSSEDEDSVDEEEDEEDEESATLDGAAAEESTEKPKTFKELVSVYMPSVTYPSIRAITDRSGYRRLVMRSVRISQLQVPNTHPRKVDPGRPAKSRHYRSRRNR